MSSIGENLNISQDEAVNYTQGPLLVLAGAGTGKTKVLTSRIAHIISTRLAHAWNILAVTFTNKAAKEMSIRINNLIDAQGLNIGTFHSLAAKILRSNITALNLGYSSNFTIIDQDDQIKLVKNICLQNNIDVKQYPPKILHSIISRWKDQGLLPEKISESDCLSVPYIKARELYGKYQTQMINSNAMDFGDLIVYCNKLFIDNPELLFSYQERFKYILIDEYQDTNAAQYVWVRMLANKYKNICCVGDDDQSIYSWRGADVKNILRFEKDFPNAKIIKLEQNYRSTHYILKAASNIISNNKHRHGKLLWTDKLEGEKISIITCWNDKEEARYVISEIMNLIKLSKYSPKEIAILVRAGFQTRSFEEVFISNAVPYQIIGGLRFYERMEIRDILAYIRLCLNPNDNLALERIINVPKRSIGNVTLKKIKDHADEFGLSIFAAINDILVQNIIKGRTSEVLAEFVKLINHAGAKFINEEAVKVVKFILEESGYLALYKNEKTDESRARIENINEMLSAIEEYNNIEEFVEHSSLVMDNDSLESDYGGTVKVMTLHAAKGLEFDLVFLPGWEENIFPHQKALSEEGDKGLEEERRIAYVGITRARKKLIITYAESRRIFSEFVNSLPSRFIKEIPAEYCISNSSSKNLNYLGTSHSFVMNSNKARTNWLNTRKESNKSPGTRVKHNKFGNGIIIKTYGDSLDIAFEKFGLKTIKQDYVELI